MWHDIEQGSDEWFDLRAGKVTGSSIGKIMANFGKAFGDPAKKLASVIAVEQITGKCSQESVYSNVHMERGNKEEPIARALYEQEFFTPVESGGFYDNGMTGCSPDGRPKGGLIEIKSQIVSVHYDCIRKGGFAPAYKWQYFFNLRESGRDWLDFVSYCSDFPVGKRLYVYRILPENLQKEMDMMKSRLEQFWTLVEKIKKDINGL